MPKGNYLYGITDDKFVRSIPVRKSHRSSDNDRFRYIPSHILQVRKNIDTTKTSIVFSTSPETLLNLASSVVNTLRLPTVYSWTIEDICRWLRNYGYPQYQNTFRENLVNGHTLLLVDAAALSAMNIKNFDHIKDIAYGIRGLYYYQMAKYARSIALPPNELFELYRKFRAKNGQCHDTMKRTEVWRSMKLLREQRKYYDHWGALEHHLNMDPYLKYPELFGGARHHDLLQCNRQPRNMNSNLSHPCSCTVPCLCQWKTMHFPSTFRLSGSTYLRKPISQRSRLDILEKLYPHKYGVYLHEIHELNFHTEVIRFQANSFSSGQEQPHIFD